MSHDSEIQGQAARPPLVSVIMPCFKTGRYIGEALASVGSQSYPHWEIIAVDDCGPEDGTLAAIENFAAKFASHRIEVIRHSKNRGISSARNTAVAAARGEWCAFLDPDDGWPANYLQSQVDYLSRNGTVDVVYGGVDVIGVKGEPLGPQDPSGAFDAGLPTTLYTGNCLVPSATMVKTSVLRSIGGFDEELSASEDYDLWIRLALKNHVFRWSRSSRAYYRRHQESMSSNRDRMLESTRVVLVKHRANPEIVRALRDRVTVLEEELRPLHKAYEDLVRVHRRTFDRRIKDTLRKILRLK